MTFNALLSPRAQADLVEIWDYSFEQWGFEQAELYLRQLKAYIETIASNPQLGRSCDYIRSGYFRYRAGVHILFYHRTVHGIDIVRILHERMDFKHHLS